ncbi:preprotein translocase subunit YajC [Nocardia zapadnayensis]|uniref:preprotein translocase subunit YajC n=1 Tax=Nocardia rhamnosiphila TaxID=426716 RepID=UPI002245FFF6|nr:preprotein translocase subunit YajC [Nocardia zapadnayensis]MCX0272234.1 preprotein translocase subunit YajC [Nocardia zapadnayensis]
MDLLFPLILVALLVPMFLGMRRQKKEADKVAQMQDSLKVGDRVTTTSGLYGTVVEADDTSVDLEIAEDVVTTWLRAAIRDVRTDDETAGDSAEGAESTDSADAPAADAPAAAEETPAQTETRLTKD